MQIAFRRGVFFFGLSAYVAVIRQLNISKTAHTVAAAVVRTCTHYSCGKKAVNFAIGPRGDRVARTVATMQMGVWFWLM